MTQMSGTYQCGTIFKMTPSGKITILKHLRDYYDGSYPQGSLTQGADGNFYGMANRGGNYYNGSIFKITPEGKFTVLHHFNFNYNEGAQPKGGLVQGADGSFYGMTQMKGKNNAGTIFKITATGTFTLLHHFNSATDGGTPYGNLVQGSNGQLYGMTTAGGKYKSGTVFSISPEGTFSVLRHFDPTSDGGKPCGSLIFGQDGYLFGLTSKGGQNKYGTAFKIALNGTFSILRHLSLSDGINPQGSLVLGRDGSAYGITANGGTKNLGTYFKITAAGVFSVISPLRQSLPFRHNSSLVPDEDGNFYGMAHKDGARGGGSIFKITVSGIVSVLAEFPDISNPLSPSGSLVQAQDGSYYGMAGTIFKTCNGNFSAVALFDPYTTGNSPAGDLIQGKDGNFYGMTSYGGTYYGGTIFKVTPAGILTVLHPFKTDTEGGKPYGSLVQGKDGNFYGMTSEGGTNPNEPGGTIFKMTPDGTFSVLKKLDSKIGSSPHGNLIQAQDGNFYGMTTYGGINKSGTIFKVTATGTYTVLHHFKAATDGRGPSGSLLQGRNGNLYGMTSTGGKGTDNAGTIFKISVGGIFTVLHDFDYTVDGGNPSADLVQGSDGSFYGMTSRGGTFNAGTIFKINSDGAFTVLRHFNPSSDGANPGGNLVVQKANPIAPSQNISVLANTAKPITLQASAPGSPLSYTIQSPPRHGTLTGSGANYTYLPQASFTGSDSFTFTATWGCQTSAVTTVAISVTGNQSSIPLSPVADTYVHNGSYADSNFGQAPALVVKGNQQNGYARSTYLKFSLEQVNSVRSAKLRIYGRNTENNNGITTAVFGIEPDNWTETGLTWHNAPLATTPALSTVAVTNQAQYYEWDVTSFVQTQLAGDRTVSLILQDVANQNRKLEFNSRENTLHPPQLLIESATVSTIRLNSGGNAVNTSMGSFSADAYFSGATSITTSTAAIANTQDDKLYQTTRKAEVTGGRFAYAVPVSNGTYTVKLHLVELAFTASGRRKFNVSAEGISWLTNYDIYAAAGGAKKAIVASKTIMVKDGMLNLNFVSLVDKASIAAIEVVPVTAGARQAVAETKESFPVQLYPNPATNRIRVKLPQPVPQISTYITDVTGVKYQYNTYQLLDTTTLEIPVSSLSLGVYMLYLQTGQDQQILKFIKQ
ncbi:DNRLRE domain-containing protein (plasmid) [Adhaeribacter swui]|uniref:DNRLRE domain-containing protein n=1 Tax=Adhaeribacter swui TaxID=2086471 RepID=A0A7G7G2E5_9BACT|nr:choice-of-anchor tandem repeat GloVer-containing protein [Adhaeribacter swui]QNF31329.1 DNRLRE domain-containing protein [Adhaeribacter swui]